MKKNLQKRIIAFALLFALLGSIFIPICGAKAYADEKANPQVVTSGDTGDQATFEMPGSDVSVEVKFSTDEEDEKEELNSALSDDDGSGTTNSDEENEEDPESPDSQGESSEVSETEESEKESEDEFEDDTEETVTTELVNRVGSTNPTNEKSTLTPFAARAVYRMTKTENYVVLPKQYTTTWKCINKIHNYTHSFFTTAIAKHVINGVEAYCIQPNVASTDGTDYTGTSEKAAAGLDYWDKELTTYERNMAQRLMAFAYPNKKLGLGVKNQYTAAQVLMWELLMHKRKNADEDALFYRTDAGLYNAVYNGRGTDFDKAKFKTAYDTLVKYVEKAAEWAALDNADRNPSFATRSSSTAPTYSFSKDDLKYDSSAKTYTLKIVDENMNNLLKYDDGEDVITWRMNDSAKSSYASFTNKYKNTVTVTIPEKNLDQFNTSNGNGLLVKGESNYVFLSNIDATIWTATNEQTLLTMAEPEYVNFYFRLYYEKEEPEEKPGKLSVLKKDAVTGEVVAGAKYAAYTNSACTTAAKTKSGNNATFTTTEDGSNVCTMLPGTYYIKETSPATKYLLNTDVVKVVVKEKQTSTVEYVAKVSDTPAAGLRIIKRNPLEDDFRIAGAVYGVYTDKACTKLAKDNKGKDALLTTTDISSNTVYLKIGTYYIKEKTPPESGDYQLSNAVYEVTLTEDDYYSVRTKPVWKSVYDYPTPGKLNMIKVSTSDPNTVVAGAEYTVYTDNACKTVAKTTSGANAVLVTTAKGSNTLTMYPGTYYVKETKAATNYQLNSKVYSVEVTKNKTTTLKGQNVSDTPIPEESSGSLSMNKKSSDTELTANNPLYSLDGAQYAVWTMVQDYKWVNHGGTDADGNPTYSWTLEKDGEPYRKRLGTLTVDKDGNSDTITESVPYFDANATSEDETPSNGINTTEWLGTYYAQEIVLPTSGCYGWCECEDGKEVSTANGGYREYKSKVHVMTSKTDAQGNVTASFTCKEPPLNDPFSVQLQKLDADTGEAVAPGTASLEGAIFEVDYYTNTDGTASGTPFKKWYFKTDEKGQLFCNQTKYLVNTDAYKSDELYRDEFNQPIYPIGTYTIKEVQAPQKYKLEGTMTIDGAEGTTGVTDGVTIVVKSDSDGEVYEYYQNLKTKAFVQVANTLQLNVADEIYKGSLTINKKDSDGTTPLAGVSFKLVGDDGAEYTGTTDADGKLVFEELAPQHYVLTETATVDGHSLLTDSIDVTIPLEMTDDEAKAQNADTSKAVWDDMTQTWCFYNQTYEISNTANFVMPMTGGNDIPWFVIAGLALLGTGTAVIVLRRRRLA